MPDDPSLTALRSRVAAFRTRVYRGLRRRAASYFNLSMGGGTGTGFANITLEADVIVYFPDDPSRLYQLEQWLPTLERLNEQRRVLILTRHGGSLRALADLTALGAVFVKRLRDLNDLYESGGFKVALYVNNSAFNFHSLMFSTMIHMHLNHGESDKISMASNQAKAYDRVVVAGQAAVDRYRNNVLEFDTSKVVRAGRPQLDVEHPRTLPASNRPTVLYAPTWQGERESMNYTSLDVYGVRIVRQILAAKAYRLVYKPHPRVADPASITAGAHEAIVAAMKQARADDPGSGHRVEMSGQINALFADCDAMITDVSSVGLDFLYLATDKPLLLTDRHNDEEALLESAPVAAGSYLISGANVNGTETLLRDALASDTKATDRRRIRHYYFGDLAKGKSTAQFLAAVEEAIEVRDKWVRCRGAVVSRPHTSDEMVAGA